MLDDSSNRKFRDLSPLKWHRGHERRTSAESSGITESELASSMHEGASSFDRVREYIKHRKHPSR